jgi:hypothetical protein
VRQRSRLGMQQERDHVLRDGALASLAQHPSWPEFVEEIKEKEAFLRQQALAKFLSVAPVSQREVDYLRGFINGMKWVTTVPKTSENTLERYLKRQGVTIAEEALAQAEGE